MEISKDVLTQTVLVLLGGSNPVQLYILLLVELMGLLLSIFSIRAERGLKRFSKLVI